MENSISQIHLLSVHLNAEKDSVIRNLEDIRQSCLFLTKFAIVMQSI